MDSYDSPSTLASHDKLASEMHAWAPDTGKEISVKKQVSDYIPRALTPESVRVNSLDSLQVCNPQTLRVSSPLIGQRLSNQHLRVRNRAAENIYKSCKG